MSASPSPRPDEASAPPFDPHHCVTCSDEGLQMVVVAVDEERWIALCEGEDGVRASVEVALVDCAPGDTLLVHAGTALLRVPTPRGGLA